MKPGYKTTEFWLTLAASFVGLVFASGIVTTGSPIEKLLGLGASVLATLGYNVSRGLAKGGQAPPAP